MSPPYDPSALVAEQVDAALSRAAAGYADADCIDFMGRIYSYARINNDVNRVARGLQDMGIAKGDRVALLLPNSPYFVVFYYAIMRIGAVCVSLNPLYSQKDLKHQIDDSGVRILVTMDIDPLMPKAVSVYRETNIEKVVVCSMARALSTVKGVLFSVLRRRSVLKPPKEPEFLSYEDVVANSGKPAKVEIDPDDIAAFNIPAARPAFRRAPCLPTPI